MDTLINFLGIGLELGQTHSGLNLSHRYIEPILRNIHGLGFQIQNRGEIFSSESCKKIFSLSEVSHIDWSHYREAYQKILSLLHEDQLLINWGGDHSIALSTVGAFSTLHPDGVVLWIDAHADLNLPHHSLSGNIHGMPASILMNLENSKDQHFKWLKGQLLPENLIYLGLRDTDPFEHSMIQDLNIKCFTAKDIRRYGINAISRSILDDIEGRPLHITFDIDSVNPDFAPSTGVRVPGGLSTSDLIHLGNFLSHHQELVSVDLVEINPELGTPAEVWQTYSVALTFLLSLLNKGVSHVNTRRPSQAYDAVSMESFAQISC